VAHELCSEHTRASRHSVVRHRSTNQENKGSNNGAESITPGAGTALQEGERIQELGHAVNTNRIHVKGVHMKCQMHVLSDGRLMWQEVPQVSREVSGVRATTWGSFATEEIVLNTAPMTCNQCVTPSCSRRGHGDGHLTVWPGTQTMNGNRIPVHGVAERDFPDGTQRKGNTTAAPECRSGNGGEH
jgi:hypothetical protein